MYYINAAETRLSSLPSSATERDVAVFQSRWGCVYPIFSATHCHLKLWGCWAFLSHNNSYHLHRISEALTNTYGQQSSFSAMHAHFLPCKCHTPTVHHFADRGGIWLFCVGWLGAEVLKRFSLCRHHLIYFSEAALSCRCHISDFVVLRDLGYYVCCYKSATKADVQECFFTVLSSLVMEIPNNRYGSTHCRLCHNGWQRWLSKFHVCHGFQT